MVATIGTAPRFLGGFFSWWFGELASLIPSPLKQMSGGGSKAHVLSFSDSEIVVSQRLPDNDREIARLQRPSPDAGPTRQSADRVARKVKPNRSSVIVELSADAAMRKEIELPLAVEGELRKALHFMIDRHTPLKPDDVYFDYRVLERNADEQKLIVELIVVPKWTADKSINQARDMGMAPDLLGIAGPTRAENVEIPLETEADKSGGSRAQGWISALLVVVAIALATAAVYIPLERQRIVADQAEAAVEAAKVEARVATELRQELEAAIEGMKTLVARKAQAPTLTTVLDTLSGTLPDDTWIYEFSMRKGDIRVTGNSAGASALIGLIEQTDTFHAAKFGSPVTQIPRSELERFNIVFSVNTGGEQ